jgi:hypothetical protein
MGFWSKLKKAVKKAWAVVKATVRAVVKIIIEIIIRVINLVLAWLPIQKKLRLHVFILRDENSIPIVTEGDLRIPIEYLRQTLEDKFRVKLLFYGKPEVQILPEPAPKKALEVACDSGAASNEWGAAGEYFADHLAGWNIIPINLGFPITVYVVRDIAGKIGCSLGPLTDYVTVSKAGTHSDSTLAHEIGHCCSLLHRENDSSNLMYPNDGRKNGVTGWQKFVFRNSRHCTFW